MQQLVWKLVLAIGLLLAPVPAHAELLGEEWISEAELKRQSNFARRHQLILVDLQCKFQEGVDAPGREHVLLRADFKQTRAPVAWGWTMDANAPLLGPEKQAIAAGFQAISEDYFEITGQTWVRCKVWHRPQ